MRAQIDAVQVLLRAADRAATYPYKAWGFGESIAMLGLLAAAQVTGVERYRHAVEAAFDRWWRDRAGVLSFEDHVTPGLPLLLLARDDPQWTPAALALGKLYTRFPMWRGVAVHRPDLGRWAAHVWVDCLYTDGPFLALLGRITGDAAWQDLACQHTLAYVNVLWDPASALFCHGYDAQTGDANAVHWGRGNGWALLGLIDLIRFLRADHPSRRSLEELVNRQIAAIVRLQNTGGHWHTVLNRAETYLETSVAAMMAWALPQAVRRGLAGPGVLDAAERAMVATLAAVDPVGDLMGVSEATPAGDLATYASRPTGVFPWGQGPLLLALADRLAPDRLWEDLE